MSDFTISRPTVWCNNGYKSLCWASRTNEGFCTSWLSCQSLARAICVEQDFSASAQRLFTCEKGREARFETNLAVISWEDRNLCGVEHRTSLLGADLGVTLLLAVRYPQVFSASARRLFTWGKKAQAWFITSKRHKPWDTRNLKPLSAAVPEVVPGVACQGSRCCRVKVEDGG